ncbi:hypothetical protein GIB67_022821 [Kingdonia uniflora]|uniref:APO domain-containing protein n=1 Tax=Kingdonia uniflora TaxID=39325 RepID=A0A7J7P717_9MAGN|nr:hypothetical protein GIB67_022821 [Kingdonia uniflora]
MLSRLVLDFINRRDFLMKRNWFGYYGISRGKSTQVSSSTMSVEAYKYIELLRRPRKSERKPFVVGVNELKRRARMEKEMKQEPIKIILRPPENGILVKNLVPVAHQVYTARLELFTCVSKVMECIPVYSCSVCEDVHVGPVPHMIRTCRFRKEHRWEIGSMERVLPLLESFHLYDRLGRAVSHEECLQVDRIPAIIELCVQAGVDIPDYPTRRRDFPVYNIAGKMIDFERRFPKDDSPGKDINPFVVRRRKAQKPVKDNKSLDLIGNDLQGYAVRGMDAWEKVRLGVFKLMQKYAVQTCGFCSEVQVGPKGHRVRECKAYKHQMRDGQHAWQEATIDNLLPPVFVWHVQDPKGKVPLLDELKRYYGKLPAAVELLWQAGAHVAEDYRHAMRGDVAVPILDEESYTFGFRVRVEEMAQMVESEIGENAKFAPLFEFEQEAQKTMGHLSK